MITMRQFHLVLTILLALFLVDVRGTCDTMYEEDGKDVKCRADCICKALTMGFVNPAQAAEKESTLSQQLILQTPQNAGPFPLPNPVDSICMTLLSAPSEALARTVGLEGTTKIKEKPLGKKGECLDTCFRLSAYMQQNPIGNECTVFGAIPASKPDDPVDLLTRNIHIPIDQRALQPLLNFRFRALSTSNRHAVRKSNTLPSFWRTKLGITEENRDSIAKTAKYYSQN